MVNRKLKIFGITTLALLILVGVVSASTESHALVTKGISLANSKQYDDALSNFNRAINLDPQDAEAWYFKGLALTQEFKIKEANAAFDQALLLNPNYSSYYISKSLGLYMQGKYTDAENYVDKSLVLNPNDSVGWGVKGIIAEAKGDKAVAIFAYNKANEPGKGRHSKSFIIQMVELND